jgi:hypothetical protein
VSIDRHIAHLRQLEVHAWLRAVSQLLRLQELYPNESSVTVAHAHNRKKWIKDALGLEVPMDILFSVENVLPIFAA